MRVTFSSDEFSVNNGDFVYGDSDGTPEFVFSGGNDVFYGEDGPYQYTAVGDAYGLIKTDRGGNDSFYGGDNAGDGYSPGTGVTFIGDAIFMTDNSTGGRDYAEGGNNSSNLFIGDASDASGLARGGNDTLIGGDAVSDSGITLVAGPGGNGYSVNLILGDFGSAGGGRGNGNLVGALAPVPVGSSVKGGHDVIVGGDSYAHYGQAFALNLLGGDANVLGDSSKAGDDTINGGDATASDGTAGTFNVILGDAGMISDAATGGRDVLYGGDARVTVDGGEGYALNYMAGDSLQMGGFARAGADTMYGGDARNSSDGKSIAVAFNLMAGDTFSVSSSDASFGRDTMVGGTGNGNGYAVNVMFGDVGSSDSGLPFPFPFPGPIGPGVAGLLGPVLRDKSVGELQFAGDNMTGGGGNSSNLLVGDASWINSDSTGGNDTLIAGNAMETTLIGDAITLDGRGGNDKLYSGKGNDEMWGDAQKMGESARGGADRFYFGVKNGDDTIHDFNVRDNDKIDLSAFKGLSPDFKNFAALKASGRLEQISGTKGSDGVLIHLDLVDKTSDHNTVLLIGVDLGELVKASFGF